jgi:endonuclease YncB( thermonuclease family)
LVTLRQSQIISIVLSAWLVLSPVYAADLTGVPRIVDGDTLAIGSTKFRLLGIDAPETDQFCVNGNGDHWTCGIGARDQRAVHIGGAKSVVHPRALTLIEEPLASVILVTRT